MHGSVRLTQEAAPCEPPSLAEGLAALHDGNPVARVLPLLAAIAGGTGGMVSLPMLEDARLAVAVAA